jgi:hypothetical protein
MAPRALTKPVNAKKLASWCDPDSPQCFNPETECRAMIPSGIFSIAARRLAWYSVESMDDWAAAPVTSNRGIRRRHIERTVAQVFSAQKTFLTRWTWRLTNWNAPAVNGQDDLNRRRLSL